MAKSISLQLKEALDQVDGLTAQIADAQKQQAAHEAVAQELAAAKQTISDMTGRLDAATKHDQELSQDLANALTEIETLKAAAVTVETSAAAQTVNILADIGVPPVDADSTAKPSAEKSIADLTAEYSELLKADSRAAGEFYTNKLAPALRKETK